MAQAALALGHEVLVVSGPVQVSYPQGVEVIDVISTEELLAVCGARFGTCDGLIGAAAPCDYRPVKVLSHKIAKTGQPLELNLIETPDVVASMGAEKRPGQWVVGFALETEDQRFRALAKMERKSCDLMVLNGPEAMNSLDNRVEVLAQDGRVLAELSGSKDDVARGILAIIQRRLIEPPPAILSRSERAT